MLCDAHIHAPVLAVRDPGFPERFRAGGYRACSAAHSGPEMDANLSLRDEGLDLVLSLGMHPQEPDWSLADRMESEARSGSLAAIGEAGFDFYGDEPYRTRTPENLAAQRRAFEHQLALAERYGLPLVLHVRRALDLVFEYAPRLKRIPAAVFHSWSGPLPEARALLDRGVPAYFSFGAPILNGNRRARESCALLPWRPTPPGSPPGAWSSAPWSIWPVSGTRPRAFGASIPGRWRSPRRPPSGPPSGYRSRILRDETSLGEYTFSRRAIC